MATPTLTLAQIYATLYGKEPTLEEIQSLVAHVENNQTDIAAFQGASTPGWNAAIDQRWHVSETSSSATAYTAAMADASGNALANGMFIFLNDINQNNTGSATLDVGSTDGAVAIKKVDFTNATPVSLDADDLDDSRPALLIYSGAASAWILMNPRPAESMPFRLTMLRTPGDTGTHTLNSKTTGFRIILCGGGGGGGGGHTTNNTSGGGGGGSGVAVVTGIADSGTSMPYTVGAKGVSGATSASPSSGTTGGTSTISYNSSPIATCVGGNGGTAGSANHGVGGGGSIATTGDILTRGQSGARGQLQQIGGEGGMPAGGFGYSGQPYYNGGSLAGELGGGASGQSDVVGSNADAGGGMIIIEEYR